MKPDQEQYLKLAEGWYEDRYGSMRWQRNWALVIALCCVAAVVASGLALASLAPLKTVEPYVVRVDSTEGDVKVISTVNSTDEQWRELTAEEALIESLLVQYVVAHQTYSKVDLKRLYNIVRVHSSREVFEPYEMTWRHPTESPFTLYGDDTVEVEVQSVTFFNEDTASVRFKTLWKRQGGSEVEGWFVAIARWKFVRQAIALDERWTNPLGFMVTSFRVDQERVEKDR